MKSPFFVISILAIIMFILLIFGTISLLYFSKTLAIVLFILSALLVLAIIILVIISLIKIKRK